MTNRWLHSWRNGLPACRLLPTLIAVAVLGAFPQVASAAGEADTATTATPIKHLLVLMQENHTFDNYFGTYPGADGFAPDTCMPRDPYVSEGDCVRPFHIGGAPVVDLDHKPETHKAQFHSGGMDGFVSVFAERGELADTVMGYYDDRDIPYYWNVADEYVLFDRFFASAAGGSVKNHMYWVAGAPGVDSSRESIPPEGWVDVPTIFDRLEEAGVSWKFYVQNYSPQITYRTPEVGDRGAQIVWVPLLAYGRYLDDPNLFGKIVDLREYFDDLENGTLPSVAYIVPSGASEHPPGSIQAGERFVRTLITALMASDAWDSSAFSWTYDDWGGWYEHVAPPEVDEFGYGFRVPALLVSPYAKRGHVDSTVLDFTSYLKFIQHNWGVAALAERDGNANNLLSAFDFNQPPREAVFLSRERTTVVPEEPERGVIYGAYGGAVLIGLVAIGWAISSGRFSRLFRLRLRPSETGS